MRPWPTHQGACPVQVQQTMALAAFVCFHASSSFALVETFFSLPHNVLASCAIQLVITHQIIHELVIYDCAGNVSESAISTHLRRYSISLFNPHYPLGAQEVTLTTWSTSSNNHPAS